MNATTRQTKRTPLHVAASHVNLQLCNLLIAYGALPMARDSSRRTPAHVLLESGSQSQQGSVLQCLKALVAASVNDNFQQEWLCSLLRCATQHRSSGCVRFLLEHGAEDTPCGDTKRCCLHMAASNGELGILEALLSAHPQNVGCKVCPRSTRYVWPSKATVKTIRPGAVYPSHCLGRILDASLLSCTYERISPSSQP